MIIECFVFQDIGIIINIDLGFLFQNYQL